MLSKYKGRLVYKKDMERHRKNYRLWKSKRRESKSPFFVIYSDFKDIHLKNLSGGALKLFLFLGFHINTFTGECWVSTDNIADFFGNDPRTVKNWFKELEEKGLVARIQTGYKRVANTFFLPYGEDEVE
jgi:hypothetical protein